MAAASTSQALQVPELNVQAFHEDVSNAVHTYVADGVDALERHILVLAPQLEKAVPGTTEIIQKGLVKHYDQLQHSVEQALVGFQQLTAASIFYVPPPPAQAPQGASSSPNAHYTAHDEQELDEKLVRLRQQISQTRRENQRLRSSIDHLDHDIMCAGTNQHFETLASSFATHQEAMSGDMLAIAEAAQQLQPLLQRAHCLTGGGTESKALDVMQREAAARQHSDKYDQSSDVAEHIAEVDDLVTFP